MKKVKTGEKYLLNTENKDLVKENGDIVTIANAVSTSGEKDRIKVYIPFPDKYAYVYLDELAALEVKMFLYKDYIESPVLDENIKAICILPFAKYEHGNLLDINGTTYGIAATLPRKGHLLVEEMNNIYENRECTSGSDNILCPHCDTELSDSEDQSDNGYIDCDYCGTEFSFARQTEVTYSAQVISRGKPAAKIIILNK